MDSDRLDEYARRAATDPGMGWAREAVRELVAEVRRLGPLAEAAGRYREAFGRWQAAQGRGVPEDVWLPAADALEDAETALLVAARGGEG